MTVGHVKLLRPHWLATAAAAIAVTLLNAVPMEAQRRGGQPTPLVNPPSQFIQCANLSQPLLKIPEIVSRGGRLRGTIVLNDSPQRIDLNLGPDRCVPQFVRSFRAIGGILPGYPGAIPPGFPGYVSSPPANQQYTDPMPGPTLRARLGDVVELTFLNHIDLSDYGDSIDRGERGQGCDESSKPYPGTAPAPHDTYPDCLHGSSTGNIHFHGTHTSPSTTADNVFIEVRPSPHDANGPIVTEESVKAPFDDFFSACEIRLRNNVLAQWPRTWADLPSSWTNRQEELLKAYDSDPTIVNKLWPIDKAQLAAGAWPQYYIGAFPFCFRLPRYTATTWPPPPARGDHAAHDAAAAEDARVLLMGQSPGTHWYHAHKHGSTTINVMNGMTGAFIIEGPYDDALNIFYGVGWTGAQPWSRQQPVLVINELGVSPKLFGGGNTLPFSVNGRRQPKLTMQPGEVRLWRVANTSSRSGTYFMSPPQLDPTKPYDPGKDFQWKQTAQDGVQFSGANYNSNQNRPFLLAAGNRADLLVKAPPNSTGQPQIYTLQVRSAVSRAETQAGTPVTLLTVEVASGPTVTGNQSAFIPQDQFGASFPPFLADITPDNVRATKTIVFESANGPPFTEHTIDGKKFDGNIGQVVLLNTVEEWKIENRTLATGGTGAIDHPFHIHINPFQVVEVFNPNQTVTNAAGQTVPKFVFYNSNPAPDPAQCYLDPTRPDSWKDCHAGGSSNIWWDVFPIPSALAATDAAGQPIIDPKTGNQLVVPGYFKMRSRFVDYTGLYVIHCHILAHEDRGMMTIVEVVPYTTTYSHQ
jgi:FtsP/CotA-like multicopper oxidase with cupredoxin domain